MLVDLNGAASHLITSHFDITKEGKLACREATLSRSTVWKKKSLLFLRWLRKRVMPLLAKNLLFTLMAVEINQFFFPFLEMD